MDVTPHLRRKQSTFSQMLEFFACISVLWVAAIIYYFVSVKSNAMYGVTALLNGIIGMAFAVLADILWNLPVLWNRDIEDRGKEYCYRILHSYSIVSGLLLALLCPIGIAWWQLGVTSFVAIMVAKLVFGGFGSNIMNPAIFGRLLAQLAFASGMKTTLAGDTTGGLISAGASVPGQITSAKGFSALISGNSISLGNLMIGNYRGALGETFAILLILICVYLCVRKIIDWRTPVAYIGVLYLAFILVFLGAGDGAWAFKDALSYTLIGGILFGGILCLTDPVTSPTSRSGRIIFALGAALLTLIIRLFTNAPEGVAYSILTMNILVPFIDKVITGRTRNNKVPVIVISVLCVLILALGLTYGLTHKIDPSTGMFLNALED